MCVEISVVLKDPERRYRKKFLVYDTVTLDVDCHLIRNLVEEAKKDFQGQPEDVQIVAKMTL